MGSWYTTCGISQLPVFEDDEVIIVMLEQRKLNGKKARMVYSNSLFTPVSPPMKATYEDYGRYDYIMDERVKKIVERKNENEIYKMIIHKKIYDLIQNQYGSEVYWFTRKLTLKQHFEKHKEEFVKGKIKENETRRINVELTFNKFQIALNELEMIEYNDIEIYEGINDDLLNSLVNLMVLNEAMEHSRKLWTPQSGEGSQYVDYEMVNLIQKASIEIQEEREHY